MTLLIIGHDFHYEMERLTRVFFPGEKIAVTDCRRSVENADGGYILTRRQTANGKIALSVYLNISGTCLSGKDYLEEGADDREIEVTLSKILFKMLCDFTGIRPPWGILTGVRPVRLMRNLITSGLSESRARDHFISEFMVLPGKADLALSTMRVQQRIDAGAKAKSYSLYVSIPFCPTRCLYCSFVSHAVDKVGKLIPKYLEALLRELEVVGEVADKLGLRLNTIYIGGGTPTVLLPEELELLLQKIAEYFPVSCIREYTVEAGRPDSISREKLGVIQNYGANRISINPQTMDDAILKEIGREHSSADVVSAFHLARKMGFDNINMDLIAGLPGDTINSFKSTLEKIVALQPDSITIHTLTVKRSSHLRASPDAFKDCGYHLSEQLLLSQKMLCGAGYFPYYLYRQQGTRQNQENVGYALPGKEGLYNIVSMEEMQTILAAGAGGVTKLCGPQGRIVRVAGYKYPYEYIDHFDEILLRKKVIANFYNNPTDDKYERMIP